MNMEFSINNITADELDYLQLSISTKVNSVAGCNLKIKRSNDYVDKTSFSEIAFINPLEEESIVIQYRYDFISSICFMYVEFVFLGLDTQHTDFISRGKQIILRIIKNLDNRILINNS